MGLRLKVVLFEKKNWRTKTDKKKKHFILALLSQSHLFYYHATPGQITIYIGPFVLGVSCFLGLVPLCNQYSFFFCLSRRVK